MVRLLPMISCINKSSPHLPTITVERANITDNSGPAGILIFFVCPGCPPVLLNPSVGGVVSGVQDRMMLLQKLSNQQLRAVNNNKASSVNFNSKYDNSLSDSKDTVLFN